jgi:signal peptidase I
MGRILRTASLAAALAAAAAVTRLVRYEIAEHSMEPTLSPGDWVIGIRSPRRVRRGDVVVVDHPDRPGFEVVKRVVAVAGDGDGPPLAPGELWVEGDAGIGVDSREFGPVLAADVRARLGLRYRPLPPSFVR